MKSFHRGTGVRVSVPDTWTVESEEPPRRRTRGIPGRVFGPVPMPGRPDESITGDLIGALETQDIQLVDLIPLQTGPAPPATARGLPDRESDAGLVEVGLGSDEDAVVLLEQDGMFSWNFPSALDSSPPGFLRSRSAPAGKVARFELRFQGAPIPGMRRRGLVTDFLFGQVRAIVLKFAARAVAGHVLTQLERKTRRGIVAMISDDPQAWPLMENVSELSLPTDRPARLLLFVHGTFSSTVGSFGALGATPWGRSFLAAVRANYDAVIGFDHATLSEDPLANAADLARRLQSGPSQPRPQIDAISYSRGAIVLRSLLEHLLPQSTWRPLFDRSVFVGAVNNGTLMAAPENWHTLVDLYTNLAAAACRVVSLMPYAAAGTALLREAIQSVGAFVKYLATETVTAGGIPGLAAMEPAGDFIRNLNETQPGQPLAVDSQFFAITSSFSPGLVPENARDLPRRLVLALAGGLVDQLMGEANDLVVNSSSVTCIDPHAGQFIKDQLDFGNNGAVYHTNYFLQPQTTNALARWLCLQTPQLAAPARLRSMVRSGGIPSSVVPASVDTDVIVVRGDEAMSVARQEVLETRPSHVVVERFDQGRLLRYALPTEDVLARTDAPEGATVLEALHLHDSQPSPAGSIHDLPRPDRSSPEPTARRVLALDGETVIGVVPERDAPLPAAELAELAARVAGAVPERESTFIERRRGLPTFATAPAPMAEAAAEMAGPLNTDTATERPKATVHFCAAIDEEVASGTVASIEVTLSRETIEWVTRPGAAGGQSEVETDRKLIVLVVPKVNFICAGESRAELHPPEPGKPVHLYFDVQPTNEGPGEIWVVIRQGQVPMVTLVLRPHIVGQRGATVRRLAAPATTTEAPRLVEPVHELSIFEQRNGDEVRYHFIFSSPELGLKNSYLSPPLRGDRARYVNALYQEIERRWVSSQNDVEAFHAELRAFGGQLWDELLPPELQRDLWEHRDRIRSVWVFSEEPFIPWELVHLKAPGKPLGDRPQFLAQLGLVRWLHNIGLPPQLIRWRAGRAFHVTPNYPHPDYALPHAQTEATFLESELGSQAVQPFPNPVRKLLAGPGAFDLLHFACHGIADSDNIANAQLLLQGRVERGAYVPEYLSATTVEQFAILAGADGNRPAVIINACQAGRAGYQLSGIGGFARAFLRREAGLFIGTLWSVGDQPARHFTEEFYRRLHPGERVAEAVMAGREAARKANEATWLAYVVYGHPHATVCRD